MKTDIFRRRASVFAALASLPLLSACIILAAALDPRPVGAPNLVLDNGMVWQQAQSMDLDGTWIDADGSRLRMDLDNGLGQVSVETEDTKFFWTTGDILARGATVQLTRRLGSDEVDSDVGQLDFARGSSNWPPMLVIEFKRLGRWQRVEPVPFATEWIHGETPIRFEQDSSDAQTLKLTGDASIGWSSARGRLRGIEVPLVLKHPDGTRSSVNGKLTVGLPRVSPEVQQMLR
jgi:hypothetical protein